MKYTAANDVLPAELLEQIQKYIQGQYIYIPKEKGLRASWGSNSGTRKYTKQRNDQIRKEFLKGKSKELLAKTYCLSVSSIKKIVYK
ncbi:MAG: CD3324 family protein [Clostridium sp.]